jgi:4-azaleucine resistance transporter AzlC
MSVEWAAAVGGRSESAEHTRLSERRAITRAAVGIGVYAAVFGATFGAVAVTARLSVSQTTVMSALMFTGASQFALIGVLASGGSAIAALAAALLLGLRNAFYGIPVAGALRPRGLRRLLTAHFIIDESTAMMVAQEDPRARRYAFWATGLILWTCWTLGSLAGALVGASINPASLGLDAAAPAVFLALLWPQLSGRQARRVALGAAAIAVALIPLVPAGVPVIAAAAVAIAAALTPRSRTGR